MKVNKNYLLFFLAFTLTIGTYSLVCYRFFKTTGKSSYNSHNLPYIYLDGHKASKSKNSPSKRISNSGNKISKKTSQEVKQKSKPLKDEKKKKLILKNKNSSKNSKNAYQDKSKNIIMKEKTKKEKENEKNENSDEIPVIINDVPSVTIPDYSSSQKNKTNNELLSIRTKIKSDPNSLTMIKIKKSNPLTLCHYSCLSICKSNFPKEINFISCAEGVCLCKDKKEIFKVMTKYNLHSNSYLIIFISTIFFIMLLLSLSGAFASIYLKSYIDQDIGSKNHSIFFENNQYELLSYPKSSEI